MGFYMAHIRGRDGGIKVRPILLWKSGAGKTDSRNESLQPPVQRHAKKAALLPCNRYTFSMRLIGTV